jgi:hypothetical protein
MNEVGQMYQDFRWPHGLFSVDFGNKRFEIFDLNTCLIDNEI